MAYLESDIKGIFLIKLDSLSDNRGEMSHHWDNNFFKARDIDFQPKQVLNQLTTSKGTIRGLHYAYDPYAESKMIIPNTGKMFWVSIDLRRESETFGKSFTTTLEPFKFSLFAVRGFAHGCLSMTDNVNLTILADNIFSDEHSGGIIWNDKDLKIKWPLESNWPLKISSKHKENKTFKDFKKSIHKIT